ncbi:hypothetical protein [Kitasatospora aureofaciens]|nr:hypothetical protein [Kitasatospora aureofaciens]MBV6702993.1 hypothetical protein [Kitasatospora aureofaciens]
MGGAVTGTAHECVRARYEPAVAAPAEQGRGPPTARHGPPGQAGPAQ